MRGSLVLDLTHEGQPKRARPEQQLPHSRALPGCERSRSRARPQFSSGRGAGWSSEEEGEPGSLDMVSCAGGHMTNDLIQAHPVFPPIVGHNFHSYITW